ncbi:MAG: hypothetical protein DI582_06690 [Azospirillum brasilense]|nr:MAG: hypothetical protein DI582_06690 [Azospirillum brasilense]
MPRYIRRRSSRSTASDGDRLQEALLRQLEREGEKLLKRMASEFTRDLEQQSRTLLQDLFSAKPGSAGSASGAGPLVNTAASLIGVLVSQASARSSTTTSESERSRATAQAFRVSRGQSMAEAAQALAKSDRNL